MIRIAVASVFLAISLFVFLSEVIGFFRFKYIMMRIHAAGIGDTLGIGAAALAVAILWGSPNACLKLLLIVLFLFLTNPVLTHLLANIELRSHNNAGHEYDEEDRA